MDSLCEPCPPQRMLGHRSLRGHRQSFCPKDLCPGWGTTAETVPARSLAYHHFYWSDNSCWHRVIFQEVVFLSGLPLCDSGHCSCDSNTNVTEVAAGPSSIMKVVLGEAARSGRVGSDDLSVAISPPPPISLSIRSQSFVSDKLPVAVGWGDDCEGASTHTGTCVTNYPDRAATALLAAR